MASSAKPSRSSRSSRKPKPRSRFLRLAESGEILITRHGKPVGVLIGFESGDDWLDYRLEHYPEFLRRVAEAREGFEVGAVFDSTICRP